MIKLQFLGPVMIRKEDGSLDQTIPKGAKRVALLAYLVLAKPRGYHRRDELLALFWPDSGKKSARNSLSNILYHLRDALGKDLILNRGSEEICVNSEKIWCDVIAFEKAVNQEELKKAFRLYKSEFLTGFHIDHVSNDFQDWLDGERDRLQNTYSILLWDLSTREKDLGNFENAHHYAQQAADLTPYSEKYQRWYIDFLVQIGKSRKAKQAFEQYAERLKTELDSVPSPDFRSYIENLEPSHSGNKSDNTVKESTIPKQHSSAESNSKGDLQNRVQNSTDQHREHIKANPNRLSKTLIRNILILIIFVLSVWFLERNYFNSGPSIQLSDKSVAVLPFTYINSPDSTDYFSLGITEEILSKLARLGDLSVTSRTSIMQYQNSDKSIREIARELGVSSVVEGSVQRHRNQVRITAQLIDAETDRHLWGGTYDRQIENILDIQSEVAARIADALQTELLASVQTQSPGERDVNQDAYHLYLQAKHLLDIREPKGVVQSIELYKESIAHDSTFAPAYGELALATLYSGLLSRFDFDVTEVRGLPLSEATDLSLEISKKALAIDSTVVEAHLSEALIYNWAYRDWKRSEVSFQKALEINPSHSDVRREYGFHLLRMGKLEEALIHMKKAVSVDPLSWAAHHGLGYAYYCAREYENAIRELQTSINLGSLYPNTKKHLSLSLIKRSQELFNRGQDEQAIDLIETGSTILDEIWGSDTGWKETVIFAATGDIQKTLQSIEENSLPFPPMLYSLLLIGQKETALQMIDQRLNFSRDRAYIDPIFDAVRNESRFKQMVERDLNKKIQFD